MYMCVMYQCKTINNVINLTEEKTMLRLEDNKINYYPQLSIFSSSEYGRSRECSTIACDAFLKNLCRQNGNLLLILLNYYVLLEHLFILLNVVNYENITIQVPAIHFILCHHYSEISFLVN